MSELNDPDAEQAPLDLDAVRHLDRVAAAAWPAEQAYEIDGWLIRHSGGVSRRVDSVAPFPVGAETLELEERIAAVEADYRAHGTPPRFQISPGSAPDDLDDVLAGRGYEIEAPVFLMTRAADAGAAYEADLDLVLDGEATDEWWAAYIEGFERDARAIVANSMDRPVFGSVYAEDGTLSAIGLGVAGDGWFGLFAMYTRPKYRRRGQGRALIAAFAEHAAESGCPALYLQVERRNAAAHALYARLGFRVAYAYHYRTLWEPT